MAESNRYVGKFIANLTLEQVKTLDCGSLRHHDYRACEISFAIGRVLS
jgi:hypothetical protein